MNRNHRAKKRTVTRNTLLKVNADQVKIPEGLEVLEFQDDGSIRVRLFSEARTILEEKTNAMRKFFYTKPHRDDVVNALVLLASQSTDEQLAERIESLNRRKPKSSC